MKSFLLPLLIGACLLVAPEWAWAQPSNSSNPQVLCFGTVEPYCVDCTENGNTGTAGSTYVWTVSATTATVQPNPSFPAVQPNPIQGNHILIDWGATPVGNYTLQLVETNSDGCSGLPITLNIQIQEVVATAVANPVLCFGGTATVTVSATGGTSPYTGTGTFTVSAGTYNYTVTDSNGCSDVVSVTVTEPTAPLNSVATAGTILCNGETTTVAVTATGGTAPYTGTGTFTVGAGAYNYTVTDANGCTFDVSGTITEPAVLSASATAGTILCNGETTTVTVTATGGTAPYTGTGTFTVGAGAYSYTVTDANGCTFDVSGTITEPAALSATATPGTIGCSGGTTTVTVTATGGTAPYTGTGTFTVGVGPYAYTVTDANGCTFDVSGTITEPQPFTVDVTAGPQICFEGSAIFTFSGGPANGTVNITVDGVAQTITLDGSGAFSLIVDSATADVDVDVVSVSDGTCTYDVTDSGTVIVSPEITTSPISHD